MVRRANKNSHPRPVHGESKLPRTICSTRFPCSSTREPLPRRLPTRRYLTNIHAVLLPRAPPPRLMPDSIESARSEEGTAGGNGRRRRPRCWKSRLTGIDVARSETPASMEERAWSEEGLAKHRCPSSMTPPLYLQLCRPSQHRRVSGRCRPAFTSMPCSRTMLSSTTMYSRTPPPCTFQPAAGPLHPPVSCTQLDGVLVLQGGVPLTTGSCIPTHRFHAEI
jgi:hypothetical protein